MPGGIGTQGSPAWAFLNRVITALATAVTASTLTSSPTSRSASRPAPPDGQPVGPGLALTCAWDGLQVVLAAGASFSSRAQGGGIWPDGAGMPDPSRKRPANQPGTRAGKPAS
jgi:hypothetical protein